MATGRAAPARFGFIKFYLHHPTPERHVCANMVGLAACVFMMTGAARAPFLTVHMQVMQIEIAVAKTRGRACLIPDQLLVMTVETKIIRLILERSVKSGGKVFFQDF